jgi:hypothetical protein
MRALIICLAFVLGLSLAPHASAQSFPPGPWRGVWTTLDGQYEYQAELNFVTEMGGHVTGQIRWMLVRTPRPEQQADIGARGTEFIEGTFESNGALTVRGVRLDDPHHILGMDDYRLMASPDGHYIAGISSENGTWQGRMDLTR